MPEETLSKQEVYAIQNKQDYAATMKKLQIDGDSLSGKGRWRPLGRKTISHHAMEALKAEDVSNWLKNPIGFEKELRGASRMLYNISGEYKSMIQYLVDMARFYHVFEFGGTPEDHAANKLKKELKILSDEFTKMNIPHEKSKILDIVMREDVFYGYEISDKHSFFILQLDSDHCRLAGKSDGMWTFEFDFGYFDTRKGLLDSYPPEFKNKYNAYANSRELKKQWQTLDFNKAVCYKFNENQREIVPPLSTTFEGLLELNDYRKYKKANTKINNYLLLHQKIPMFKDTDKSNQQNNFMIDGDTFQMFHQMLDGALPEEIGAVVSPMEIEAIQLDKRSDQTDKVAEVTRDIYNAAGINQYLFNPDKSSTAGLSKSIKKDEAVVINFYLQVARWMNRKIKLNHPKWTHWNVKLLGTTQQSEEDYAKHLVSIGTLGFPVIGAIGAMLGYDIQKVESMTYLENEVLGLKEKMIPFASSHTMGAKNEGGRPQSDDSKISESGQANKDSNDGVKGGEK